MAKQLSGMTIIVESCAGNTNINNSTVYYTCDDSGDSLLHKDATLNVAPTDWTTTVSANWVIMVSAATSAEGL